VLYQINEKVGLKPEPDPAFAASKIGKKNSNKSSLLGTGLAKLVTCQLLLFVD
jgi:hypothetical protein